MTGLYSFDNFLALALFLVTSFPDVIAVTDYGSLSVIQNEHIWKLLQIRNVRSANTKTEVNVTSSEKQLNYDVNSTKIKPSGATQCFNESADNGTFYCPQHGESPDLTSCCGDIKNQYCCVPKNSEKKQHDVTLDLITALSVVIGFIVAVSCCLLLYCCCCQKRSGVHTGKIVWIKRKKSGNKTVYTTSDNPDIDDEQEGTELVGFVEQNEDNGKGSRRPSVIDMIKESESRRGSKASIDQKQHHHHHHNSKPETDGVGNNTQVPVFKHVTPSGQILMVPLINIQGSTPGTSPS